MNELSLTTRSVADHTVLEVSGEVDAFSASHLRDRLIEMVAAGRKRVVVDLTRVEFLDSSGLGVLVGAHRRLKAGHGTLTLVCPQERLRKLFRITGLESEFDIRDSIEEATRAGAGV